MTRLVDGGEGYMIPVAARSDPRLEGWTTAEDLVGGVLGTLASNLQRSAATGHKLKAAEFSPAEVEFAIAARKQELTFRQQESIGPFWADFYFPEAAVVVEIDGRTYHDAERDHRRDAYMLANGVERVFRFSAAEAFAGADACVERLRWYLEEGKG